MWLGLRLTRILGNTLNQVAPRSEEERMFGRWVMLVNIGRTSADLVHQKKFSEVFGKPFARSK